MRKDRKLSIGIIGTGGIANQAHLPSLRDMDNVELAAICSIDRKSAEETAKKFSVPHVYTLYGEMLEKEELDAVFALVPPDQIFRCAMDCLSAGVDVFIEKPPGITLFQAEALLKKSQEVNRILHIGFNRRYIPLIRHVLKIMKESTRITQVEGCFYKYGSAEFYGGCASALECDVIHVIDLVRWIAGGEPVAAATVEGRENSVVPNMWSSVVRFDNNVTGIIKANYQTGGRVHRFEIHGPGVSAFINMGFGTFDCEADILFYDELTCKKVAEANEGDHLVSMPQEGSRRLIHIDGMKLAGSTDFYKYYGFYQEDREFIECVANHKRPLTDISEAVKTMRFIDLLNASRI